MSTRQVTSVNARRLMKTVYASGISVVRSTGLLRFAREMIDVDTLLAETAGEDERVAVRRWVAEEQPRSLFRLPAGDEIPALDGVRTTISLLDITQPGYSLRNGFLVDPDRRVVYEKKVLPLFGQLRVGLVPLERPKRVGGVIAWLSQSNNYGHWLFLALPLIRYYRELLGGDADYYYVGSPVTSLHIESLGMLGIRREQIVGDAVEGDRLLVAIADRAGGYDEDFLLFADRMLAPHAGAAPPDPRRLFVSRAGASHRRIANEAECAAALRESLGVELISTEGMSLKDEIALFRAAELVVGGHGAGLTNFIFAPPGAHLIELASSTYWDSIFAQVTALKKQPYALVRGRTVGRLAGIPASTHDYVVDVERVIAVVTAALAAGACPRS